MPGDDIQDDLTISDDAILIRRVPSWHWKPEEARPTRMAFRPRNTDSYLSVFLKDEVTIEEVIADYKPEGRPGIVFLKAGDIRALDQALRIRREPEPEALPGHCGIHGEVLRVHPEMLRGIAEVILPPEQ